MKITGAIVLLFSACAPLFSQQQVQTLTHEEAVKIGLRNSVTYKTQKNQLDVNALRKQQAVAGYLPGVSASGFAQRTDGLQIDPTKGSATNVSSDFIQGTIDADYIIFNGFNRINTLKQNAKLFEAQNFLVNRAKQDVVFNVTTQYLTVLLDQELLKIAAENLETQRVTLEQIKGFVDVGSRAEADLYTQDALVQNADVTYLRAKITLENDRATLLQTLQLDPSINVEVTPIDFSITPEFLQAPDLDSLYKIAAENRSDLKQQESLVEGNEFGRKAAASGYFPSLTAFASYGSTYFATNSWKKNPSEPRPIRFSEQFLDLNRTLSYGVSVRIPIFDRFQTRSARGLARMNHRNAELQRDNLLKSVKIDVQRSYNNYMTAIQSYNASLTQFRAGELALKTQRESFELGQASQVELAQAMQTYVIAASSKAQAEVTLFFQKVLLEYALGTLKADELE